jgi:hypothetical protein
MDTVHVFMSTGRFHSFDEMRIFIDQTYTGDGDAVPSQFMREVELSSYEPTCIEAIHSNRPMPLGGLLRETSYSDQWLANVNCSAHVADAVICVFSPNRLRHPQNCSLTYLGGFRYKAAQ